MLNQPNKIEETPPVFESVSATNPSMDSLIRQLDYIKGHPEIKHANFGFSLFSLDSNRIIVDHNGNISMTPASILKMITTGVAMSNIGPNYRYQTLLQHDGHIDTATRTLNGNIYIIGGGDPTLGGLTFGSTRKERVIQNWVNAIRKLNVDTITGSIIGDASFFDEELIPSGWAWEDMQSEYCAGACGLSFNENMYKISLHKWNDSIIFHIKDTIPELKLVNNLIAMSEGEDVVYVSGSPYNGVRYLQGGLATTDTIITRSIVPDPAFYCASLLYKYLLKDSIMVLDSFSTIRRNRLEDRPTDSIRINIYRTYSPGFKSIVRHTNTESQNFYAESILKTLAVRAGKYGSSAGGVRTIYNYFQNRGVDIGGVHLVDGSGLSRFNTVTTSFMVNALKAFANDSSVFESYYSTLAIAGETGTMKRLCKGTLAQGNIKAKSGYMGRVRSYSGYVHDKKGELYAFSMIANNYRCSAVEMKRHFEKLMVLMSELE